MTESMLRKDPHDWESLYRRGVAAADLDRPELAEQAFRALLDVAIPDDEKSALARARARNPHFQGPPNAYPMSSRRFQAVSPMEERLGLAALIRMFCRLDRRDRARAAVYLVAGRLRPGAGGGAGHGWPAWPRSRAQRRPTSFVGLATASWPRSGRLDLAGPPRLALSLLGPPRLPGRLCGGPRPRPRGADRPDRALGVPAQPGRPADPRRAAGRHHPAPEPGRQYAAARQGRARSRARLLPVAPGPSSRAGPGRDPPERRRRAEAGRSGSRRSERFYREVVAGATQIGQVAAVLNMAARRGDVDGLIELAERYERLQAGRSQSAFTNGSFTFAAARACRCARG